MYTWLHEDESARVALLDATNTTKSRRQMLLQRSKGEKNAMVVFVESICDDPEILAQVGTQRPAGMHQMRGIQWRQHANAKAAAAKD